jgi:hypothetical protein
MAGLPISKGAVISSLSLIFYPPLRGYKSGTLRYALPPKAVAPWEGLLLLRGLEAMRVTNLLVADPLTGGRTIAARHPLPLRVTDLICNAGLRWGGVDRRGPEDGKNREDQSHV